MPRYIMAIDQGTTSSRTIVFNEEGRPVSASQKSFPQYFPKPGWVEHDPDEIWGSVKATMRDALQSGGIEAADIAAIGITNQRETTVLWDAATNEPVYNAIVWQSRQSAEICDELKERGLEDLFCERTGLRLDAYFSGTKLTWARRNVKGVEDLISQGRLRFGTVDTWLVHKLTGGKAHITDATNASRTLMFDITGKKWDEQLCDILEVPLSALPEVVDSSGIVAYTDPEEFFGVRVPIFRASRAISRRPYSVSSAITRAK